MVEFDNVDDLIKWYQDTHGDKYRILCTAWLDDADQMAKFGRLLLANINVAIYHLASTKMGVRFILSVPK